MNNKTKFTKYLNSCGITKGQHPGLSDEADAEVKKAAVPWEAATPGSRSKKVPLTPMIKSPILEQNKTCLQPGTKFSFSLNREVILSR